MHHIVVVYFYVLSHRQTLLNVYHPYHPSKVVPHATHRSSSSLLLIALPHHYSTTLQGIDSQLRTAAEAFLENDDGCVVDSEKREVRLSQIFKWYKADFGGTEEKVTSGGLTNVFKGLGYIL